MLADPSKETDFRAAQKMQLVWPNQNGRGAHVNISGAGVLKHAPNHDNAIKLIEYLVSDAAQQIYADVNLEFPVKKDIAINPILASWGDFKADNIALNKLGENNAAAVRLMDRAGWK
jgi:iron(III) transport system substrate-binding protein